MKYTIDELTAAKRQIDSTLHKLRETVKTFESKDNSCLLYTSDAADEL